MAQRCCAPTGASEMRSKRGVFSLAERIIDRRMEFPRIQNAIDLLGQGAAAGPRHEVKADERPQRATGAPVEPKLEVAWGSFHGGAWSHLAALFGPAASKDWRTASA